MCPLSQQCVTLLPTVRPGRWRLPHQGSRRLRRHSCTVRRPQARPAAWATRDGSFLPGLHQPRLMSLQPEVPGLPFNDNCTVLICQPFRKVFPGGMRRQKINNSCIESTGYPNWTSHLHGSHGFLWGVWAGRTMKSFGEKYIEKERRDFPS